MGYGLGAVTAVFRDLGDEKGTCFQPGAGIFPGGGPPAAPKAIGLSYEQWAMSCDGGFWDPDEEKRYAFPRPRGAFSPVGGAPRAQQSIG